MIFNHVMSCDLSKIGVGKKLVHELGLTTRVKVHGLDPDTTPRKLDDVKNKVEGTTGLCPTNKRRLN
jgi:hypothetical protein